MIGCLVLAPVSSTMMLLQAPTDMKPTYSPILAYSPDASQLNASLYQNAVHRVSLGGFAVSPCHMQSAQHALQPGSCCLSLYFGSLTCASKWLSASGCYT